jgi:hypothetical protein
MFISRKKNFYFQGLVITSKKLLICYLPELSFASVTFGNKYILYIDSDLLFCMEVKIQLCLHFASFVTNNLTF